MHKSGLELPKVHGEAENFTAEHITLVRLSAISKGYKTTDTAVIRQHFSQSKSGLLSLILSFGNIAYVSDDHFICIEIK